MKIWIRSELDTTVSLAELVGDQATIGSGQQSDIVLASPVVARHAVSVVLDDLTWRVECCGDSVVLLGDTQLGKGQTATIDGDSQLKLFPFILDFDLNESGNATSVLDDDSEVRRRLAEDAASLLRKIHMEVLTRLDINSDDEDERNNPRRILALEHHIDELTRIEGIASPEKRELVDHVAGMNVRQGILEQIVDQFGDETPPHVSHEAWCRMFSRNENMETQRDGIMQAAVRQLNAGEASVQGVAQSRLRDRLQKIDDDFWNVWHEQKCQLERSVLLYLAVQNLKKQLKDILFGYGPLEDLLRLPTVTEIMVVSSDKIYVERNGILENSGRHFVSDDITLTIIERIVSNVNRRIDKSQPLVDARLMDGSRVNAVIPPLAVSGPCLTIRRFPRRLTIDELIKLGSVTEAGMRFLKACVQAKKNIIISGGTGTGKTTFLNCLSSYFGDDERIITVEDTSELKIQQRHVVSLETKDKNAENQGAYEIRDLVKNALRMRPDRLVVGECRSAEAIDMLQAMNTGHDGSLTTLHANNPADAMLRLETLAGMSGELPIDSIRRQIASAVDVVIQIQRQKKRRFISSVSEVMGFDVDKGVVRVKHIFERPSEADDAPLLPTGCLPTFMETLVEKDLIDLEVFFS